MKLTFLDEPELEFGTAGHHIDIRFGILHFGPLDLSSDLAPKRIRLSIIGAPNNIEGAREWLERCRHEIPAKASRQPNLFPRFPGFSPDAGFHSTLVLDSVLQGGIAATTFQTLASKGNREALIRDSVEHFLAELSRLKERSQTDVALCAVPPELVQLLDADPIPRHGRRSRQQLNFHDLLKARAMAIGLPIQLILPSTYDPATRRKQKMRPDRIRQLQDEATRAWNLHAALYYKAGGLPWRLIRDPTQLTTCFVGVSFFASLDRSHLLTSMAQIFDERGDGIVVRGAPVELQKHDRTPHLSEDDANALLTDALGRYRQEHRTLPARAVVHKTSSFNDAEMAGFSSAVRSAKLDSLDLLSEVGGDPPRLFRNGAYPPLRGMLLELDTRTHLLYTRGSVDFFATYPGMYVPRPLVFRTDMAEQTPKHLAREILALTKMNWNHTQFDAGHPITLEAARKVGSILRYLPQEALVATRYSYYM